ncbi:hypothetical protein JW979_02590 [bacterium]|nr:hypothetical protein [candidate division CSSED10-310 bacterium]
MPMFSVYVKYRKGLILIIILVAGDQLSISIWWVKLASIWLISGVVNFSE